MIEYRADKRLYVLGGGLTVAQSIRPAAESEPTTWWIPATGSVTVYGAWQAKGAASLAASYVNLDDPGTNDLTEIVAPSFSSSTGWTFAGAEYLDTGHAPDTSTTALIVRFSDAASGVYTMCGNANYRLMPNRSSNVYYGATAKSPGMTSGVLAIVANIASDVGYRDGASDGTINIGAGQLTDTIYIGAQHEGANANAKWYGKIQAIAVYTAPLTATQVAEITDAMEAL